MSLVNYTVKLPKVDVPEDWTNFSRKLIVRNDNARANSSIVLLEKDVDGDEQSFSVSVQEGTDISVFLDLKNDQPTLSFRRTAGKFVAYESDEFSIFREDLIAEVEVVPEEDTDSPDPEGLSLDQEDNLLENDELWS
jgi:hypothetical protein